jgi:hypothetical protein
MTKQKYSPTTQAVSDAAEQAYWLWDAMCPADAQTIAAAALRAAAEQGMLSAEHIQGTTPDDWENGWNAAMQYIKTTAKELEETK